MRTDDSVKICCVVSSLGTGGAERVISLLANQWAARGRSVTLVTLASTDKDVYDLHPRVARIGLNVERESRSPARAIINNVRKVQALRRAVVSIGPDVVVTFVDKVNVITLLSCMALGVPVVISERVHPTHHDIGTAWSLLRRVAYPRADALVVQAEAMRPWAESVMPARRTHVIPNPVSDRFSSDQGRVTTPRNPTVLGVGRLVLQKGFDLLIKAFHAVTERHPEWSLVIVGQGPKEAELRDLAARLLPHGSVVFAGAVKDLERYYRAAGLFVLSSRFEGFPNALLEAMASGCAVIASDAPGGTSEIVQDGLDGILVPPENVGALAREMDRLMSDADERVRLGARAVEVSNRFAVDRVLARWEDLISEVRR